MIYFLIYLLVGFVFITAIESLESGRLSLNFSGIHLLGSLFWPFIVYGIGSEWVVYFWKYKLMFWKNRKN